MRFVPNECVRAMSLRKTVNVPILVLPNASDKIARRAQIQSPISFAREQIDLAYLRHLGSLPEGEPKDSPSPGMTIWFVGLAAAGMRKSCGLFDSCRPYFGAVGSTSKYFFYLAIMPEPEERHIVGFPSELLEQTLPRHSRRAPP
jgi:hypothetical protein